jgi:RHS repeat-associated protein
MRLRHFVVLLIFCGLCIPIVNGQSSEPALLADAMRQYQVRHRALHGGENYVWPAVFNCRKTGRPAPANPSNAYYSGEVEDPVRMAAMSGALLDIVANHFFLQNFVSNYDLIKLGEAEEIELFFRDDFGLPPVGTVVAPRQAKGMLVSINRALHRLNYIYKAPSQQNVVMRHGIGYKKYGWDLSGLRGFALNNTTEYWGFTKEYGWDFQSYQSNYSYQENDIRHVDGIGLSTFFEYIGFYERQEIETEVWFHTAPGVASGMDRATRAELRVIKGTITAPKLNELPDNAYVELFLKIDDLGVDDDSTSLGSLKQHNPPVSEFNDRKFALYDKKNATESWTWDFNHQYSNSFKPSFVDTPPFMPNGIKSYRSGWVIVESAAIITPNLIPVIDEGISCACDTCSSTGGCPPGTPKYANSSVLVQFPLGNSLTGKSAGYMLIHETEPTAALNDSSAVEVFTANGSFIEPNNELGVSRTVVAPLTRVHLVDNPDGNSNTMDWKIEFYSNYPEPYLAGDVPYHEVTFEALYNAGDFDRFEVTEAGELGSRLRVYDWKEETVAGQTATAVAMVADGEITGFTINAPGNRYFNKPDVTITDPTGSGVNVDAEVARGVVSEIEILNPGTGYTSPPTVEIVEPLGQGAVFEPIVVNGSIVSVEVTSQGSGYNSWDDSIVIDDPEGGSGAILEPVWDYVFYPVHTTVLESVNVIAGGAGYSEDSSISISSASGSGAQMAAIMSDGNISGVNVVAGGSGYFGAVRLDVSGTGSGASFTPVIENGVIVATNLLSGGTGYDASTAVSIKPAGNGAVVPAIVQADLTGDTLTGLTIVDGGSGYSDRAQVLFTGGDGNGAKARVSVSDNVLRAINIDSGGVGYSANPTVSISAPPADIRRGWELIYYDSDLMTPLKYEYKRDGIGDDGNQAEFLTIRDGDGTPLRDTATTYAQKSFGRKPARIIEEILDPQGNSTGEIATHFRYYESAHDMSNGLLSEQWQSDNGPWVKHRYDSLGRLMSSLAQHQSSRIEDAEDQSLLTTYSYTDEDLDQDGEDEVITVATRSLLGEVVSRSFEIWWSGTETGDLVGGAQQYDFREKWMVEALSPAVDTASEAIGATDTLITKYRYDSGSAQESRLRSVENPDGQIRIYEYGADGLSTIVYAGTKAAGSHDLSKGTKYYRLENAFGGLLVETMWAYPQDLLLTESQTTAMDGFGRPLQTNLLRSSDGAAADTVYGSRSRTYSCCGLATETDENGLTTAYLYDGLKRAYNVTQGGISTTYKFDALNRVRRETVANVVEREADYDSTGILLSEKTLFKDGLVEGTRSYDRSHPLYDIETVDHADGSQAIIQYYKDGTVYQRTGSAVLPQRFTRSAQAGEQHTLSTRLSPVDGAYTMTTEYTRTVTDMAGRLKRIETPHPTGTGEATVLYDYNTRGQLNWMRDADDIHTYATYDAYFEPSGSYVNDATTGIITTTSRGYKHLSGQNRIVLETTELLGDDITEQRTTQLSTDGLQRWIQQYGLETHTLTERNGASFSRRETNTFSDDTYTVAVYDLNGRLASRQHFASDDELLSQTTFQYDSRNRLWQSTDLRNGTTTFLYYKDGRLKSTLSVDPDEGESGLGLDPQSTQYDYSFESGGGLRTITTLPDGSTHITVEDPLGRLALTYGSQTNPAAYTYDFAGRPETLTTWQGFDAITATALSGEAVTQWVYNPAGLLQEKRYAVTSPTSFEPGPTYSYTAAGRLETRTFARGVSSRYQYNGEGLLWQVDHGDNGSIDETNLYDPAGRPRSLSDDSGTRLLNYQYGQLADETYTAGVLGGYGLDRAFDSTGREEAITLTENATDLHGVNYGYHAQTGRLETVSSGAHSFTYSYQPGSRLIDDIVFNNGTSDRLTHRRGWDALNRLTSITTLDGTQQALHSHVYAHTDLNQRRRATLASGDYWTYAYDALGQIESARKKNSSGADLPGYVYGYTFDAIGNREETTANGAVAEYVANPLNQYASMEVPRFVDLQGQASASIDMQANGIPLNRDGEHFHGQIDLSGEATPSAPYAGEIVITGTLAGAGDDGLDAVREITSRPYFPPTPYTPKHDADGNLTDDGRWRYTWNAAGRLEGMETHPLAVSVGVRQQKLEFAYDSQGRRFSKTVSAWNPSTGNWETESQTTYLFDGWNLIAEIDEVAATVKSTYVWGLDLSGSRQGATSTSSGLSAGGVSGLLAVTDTTGSTSYPAFDGNGNVMGYYDANTGENVATFEYGPFGELIRETGSKAGEFNFRFSTKYEDAETGLLYYGFRYYDPETGRWLSRDPIEERGGLNLYGMVGNDSVNQWDYLGLASFTDGVEPFGGDCGGWINIFFDAMARARESQIKIVAYQGVVDGIRGSNSSHNDRIGDVVDLTNSILGMISSKLELNSAIEYGIELTGNINTAQGVEDADDLGLAVATSVGDGVLVTMGKAGFKLAKVGGTVTAVAQVAIWDVEQISMHVVQNQAYRKEYQWIEKLNTQQFALQGALGDILRAERMLSINYRRCRCLLEEYGLEGIISGE